MSQHENKITVRVVHGKPYIWDAQDVATVRGEHRLVGRLVGCLPRLPRQNIQLGRPLELLLEEATLLLEKGIAWMCDGSVPVTVPSQQEREEFLGKRRQLYEDQVELCKVKKRYEIREHEAEIRRGKMEKRRKLLQQQDDTGSDVVTATQVNTILDDIEINALPEKSCAVQICTATQRNTPLEEVDWCYPLTEMERIRYRVFKDLWEKQYYLTSGGKFGGDFLVYPGDPARFHSFYIAVCRLPSQTLTPLDIITLGRLGANVKKTVVLCSVDLLTDKLSYMSLQWTGYS